VVSGSKLLAVLAVVVPIVTWQIDPTAARTFVTVHWAEFPGWVLAVYGGVFVLGNMWLFMRRLILAPDWGYAGQQVLFLTMFPVFVAALGYGPLKEVTMAVPAWLRLDLPVSALQYVGLMVLASSVVGFALSSRKRYWASQP
jgi:hypothetical protein